MYQEVSCAMEIEPDSDAPTKAHNHLVHSSFGIKEVKKIESLLKSVHLPSGRSVNWFPLLVVKSCSFQLDEYFPISFLLVDT
jgi:hypothetical protein